MTQKIEPINSVFRYQASRRRLVVANDKKPPELKNPVLTEDFTMRLYAGGHLIDEIA